MEVLEHNCKFKREEQIDFIDKLFLQLFDGGEGEKRAQVIRIADRAMTGASVAMWL